MSSSLQLRLQALRADIEAALTEAIDSATCSNPSLLASSRHSLVAGGKRIRPVLAVAAFEAVSPSPASPFPFAVSSAVELIHTYSLIHDDLPAMDDDDLRRGVPTLHKAFDEATAILVGDGLQTLAFQLLSESTELSAGQKVRMIQRLAAASGFSGMVGGQYVDITSEGKEIDLSELESLHAMKTGALIRAAVALGGIAGSASEVQLEALDRYARHIGLAFQVIDDILDVEGDTATLGKTQGKDEVADKATYVKLLGLDGAKDKAGALLDEALLALENFGESASLLCDIARYIVARNH